MIRYVVQKSLSTAFNTIHWFFKAMNIDDTGKLVPTTASSGNGFTPEVSASDILVRGREPLVKKVRPLLTSLFTSTSGLLRSLRNALR